MAAYIDGATVSLEAAAEAAARLLEEAHLPVIAGLGTDVAGARAAILLAEKLRGAYDHLRSEILFRDVDVLRQVGRMVTTPNDVRVRADCVLFVGPKLLETWPDLLNRLDLGVEPQLSAVKGQRKIFWLGPARGEAEGSGAVEIAAAPETLPLAVASLRAKVLERKTRTAGDLAKKLDDLAAQLKAAHFGAVVWSSESLDKLTIEMVQGLVVDLNQKTRFSNLPLGPGHNAQGVVQTSGWMTGFPVRTGFGRGYPEQDTWRFDAGRLVDTGEADAALWISAYGAEAPHWKRQVPLVALTTAEATFAYPPKVRVDVGTPGRDHDAIEWARDIATFTLADAKSPSDAPKVAEVLGLIDDHLTKGSEAC